MSVLLSNSSFLFLNMNAWKCVWKLKYLLMLHFTFIAVTVCYLDQLQILSRAVDNTEMGRHSCSCASTNKSKDKCQRRSKSRCLVCHKPRRNDVESLLYPKKLTIAVVYLIYIANSIFEALIVDRYHNTYVRFSEYRTGWVHRHFWKFGQLRQIRSLKRWQHDDKLKCTLTRIL